MPISDAKLKEAVMSGSLGGYPVEVHNPDLAGNGNAAPWRMGYDPATRRITIYTDPADTPVSDAPSAVSSNHPDWAQGGGA